MRGVSVGELMARALIRQVIVREKMKQVMAKETGDSERDG